MIAAEDPTRRSPAHDPEGRRRDVLAAARRQFAARGYAQTSIRAIATEADVNQALVVTYFGGKERLFLEAVGRFQISRESLAGGLDAIGARLAREYVDRWENMANDDPWPALVRSALTHPASQKLLRSELEAQLAIPLAGILGDDGEGPVRNAIVQCLLAGMIMERYIYALEPARSLPADVFEAALAGSLQHAITGPLPSPQPRSEPASASVGGDRAGGRRRLRVHRLARAAGPVRGPDSERDLGGVDRVDRDGLPPRAAPGEPPAG